MPKRHPASRDPRPTSTPPARRFPALPGGAAPAVALVALLAGACATGAENATPRDADVRASAGGPNATANDPAQPCDEPLVTAERNAPQLEPQSEHQFRACPAPTNVDFEVQVVADGLVHPWAVEPMPDGALLVTERPGRMRVISASGRVGTPIEGVPPVVAERQAGLLDVALSPDFARDRVVFWSYSEPRQDGNGTAVARGTLSPDGRLLSEVRVIFRALPSYGNAMHFGSRLAFGPDGMLYVTTGERSDRSMRHHAQELDNHLGKVLRIAPDGDIPQDNPFVGRSGAEGEVWSYGHRNTQALAFAPDGDLWLVEHGPRGGDELNRVVPGANYGWPIQAYGINYDGSRIETAAAARPGVTQPVYFWDPVIAPSGMDFYTGSMFPAWRGSLFVGGLASQRLVRVEMQDDRVTGVEHLLAERGQRIRDVKQGPDGALYLVADEEDGEVWRVTSR